MFYTFFLLLRPMHRALNGRSYWFIEMKIRKRLQASAFSIIALNLVEKSVLHIFLIMVDSTKEHSTKQATDNFQRRALENHGITKKINFQFLYRKFSKQKNSIISYYYRRITRGRRRRDLFCTFLEKVLWFRVKVSWFWSSMG